MLQCLPQQCPRNGSISDSSRCLAVVSKRAVLALCASAAPAAAAAAAPTSSVGNCPGGIVGLLGSLTDGPVVCCDISCTQCGGFGCGASPNSPGDCCIGGSVGIVETQGLCSDTLVGPCIISLPDGKPEALQIPPHKIYTRTTRLFTFVRLFVVTRNDRRKSQSKHFPWLKR